MAKQIKVSPFQVIRIGALVVGAIRRIQQQIKAAKGEDTPGGEKVTPAEALRAVVLGLLDAAPGVYEVVSGEKLPDDVDIVDVLSEG